MVTSAYTKESVDYLAQIIEALVLRRKELPANQVARLFLALFEYTRDEKYFRMASEYLAESDEAITNVWAILRIKQLTGNKYYLDRALEIATKKAYVLLDKDETDNSFKTGRPGVLLLLLVLHQECGKPELLALINLYIGKILSSITYVGQRIYCNKTNESNNQKHDFTDGNFGLVYVFLMVARYFQNHSFYLLARKLLTAGNTGASGLLRNLLDELDPDGSAPQPENTVLNVEPQPVDHYALELLQCGNFLFGLYHLSGKPIYLQKMQEISVKQINRGEIAQLPIEELLLQGFLFVQLMQPHRPSSFLPGIDQVAGNRDESFSFPYIGMDFPTIGKRILANSFRRTIYLLENFYPGELHNFFTRASSNQIVAPHNELGDLVKNLIDAHDGGFNKLIKDVFAIEVAKSQMSAQYLNNAAVKIEAGESSLLLSRLLCLDEENFLSTSLWVCPGARIMKTDFNPDLNIYSQLTKGATEKDIRTIVLIPGRYHEVKNEKRVMELFDLGYQQEGNIKEYNMVEQAGILLSYFREGNTVSNAIQLVENDSLPATSLLDMIRHLLCEQILVPQ